MTRRKRIAPQYRWLWVAPEPGEPQPAHELTGKQVAFLIDQAIADGEARRPLRLSDLYPTEQHDGTTR
jgi:hypothetical protein